MMADAKEENMGEYIAKWHRELGIFCRIKPLIIVEGNVLDVYQYPVEGSTPKGSILRLPEYLHYYFTDLGYKTIAFFDSMQGFYNSCEEGHIQAFAELTHAKLDGDYIRSDFKGKANSATSLVRAAVNQNKQPVAIVMNLASRYITSPDNIDQSEVDSFTNLLLASMEGKDVRTQDGTLKNLVVMIVNKVNDVPAWFYLDNPNVKTVSIGTPSKEEREWLVKGENFASFFAADVFDEDYPFFEEHPDELEKVQDRFVGLTEGFSFADVLTPNIPEAEKIADMQISTVSDMEAAARKIYAMGCKAIVATGLPEKLYMPCLKNNSILELFDALCSTDEVQRGKEYSDVFELAAKKLGVAPEHCIVFDDVLPAIKSAKAARMLAGGIYDKYSADQRAEIERIADIYLLDFRQAPIPHKEA